MKARVRQLREEVEELQFNDLFAHIRDKLSGEYLERFRKEARFFVLNERSRSVTPENPGKASSSKG